MRTRTETNSSLTDPGVIAVIRAKSSDQFIPLAQSLLAAGLRAIELTMTTPNALDAARRARERFGDDIVLGMGSVLDGATARKAIEAGAEFIVSPVTKPEIAEACRELSRPVMLGAYTPTEAQLAFEAGADFVKIFPAETLGPSYIKSLLAPLPHLRLVPTGGVDLSTIADFLKAGCAAVGVGSSLVSRAIVESANWNELTRVAQDFLAKARQARSRS